MVEVPGGTMESGAGGLHALPTSARPTSQDRPEAKIRSRSLPPQLPLPWLQQTTARREPVPELPQGRDNTSRTSACPGSNLEAVLPKIT